MQKHGLPVFQSSGIDLSFKESADIQTADMLHLPVPEAEYINEVLKPSEEQQELVAAFGERAEIVRSGGVDASVDNMLKIVRC